MDLYSWCFSHIIVCFLVVKHSRRNEMDTFRTQIECVDRSNVHRFLMPLQVQTYNLVHFLRLAPLIWTSLFSLSLLILRCGLSKHSPV